MQNRVRVKKCEREAIAKKRVRVRMIDEIGERERD